MYFTRYFPYHSANTIKELAFSMTNHDMTQLGKQTDQNRNIVWKGKRCIARKTDF